MRYPRRLLASMLILLMFVGPLAACDSGGSNGGNNNPPAQVSTDPEREDIIEAVRRGVNGKTYTDQEVKWETVTHRCTQMDVDTDIYMPNNPELAKCPQVGAVYYEEQSYTETVTKQCDSLPEPNSAWSVQETGSDRWRVNYGGDTWNVELVSGGSASVGDTVQVSSFSFVITTNQEC